MNENDCLSYIMQLVPRNSDLHSRASCYGKYNLVCPHYDRDLTEGGRTFQVYGVKLWNGIPVDVHKKDTTGSFKSALKKLFIS